MISQTKFSTIEATPLEVPVLRDAETLKQWIETQQKAYQLTYLLAHAEDGVIWGRFDAEQLVTAERLWIQSPELQPSRLQQCRIFGQHAEVMLWRKNAGWQARVVHDAQQKVDCIVEAQMVWGSTAEAQGEGFTLLADGQQGLRYALPLSSVPCSSKPTKPPWRPARLHVKHYIKDDFTGIAHIYLSRLFDLTVLPSK
jgi:CRISPR-associated protein (TIGR03984 family)